MNTRFFVQWQHELHGFNSWKNVSGSDVRRFEKGFKTEEEATAAMLTLPSVPNIFCRTVKNECVKCQLNLLPSD